MKLSEYINETKVELKHTSWPTKRQAIIYTIVVIVISISVGALLGLFDSIFTYLLRLFLGS